MDCCQHGGLHPAHCGTLSPTITCDFIWHRPTDAFVAIAGREMEGSPSLVICCTGVNVILQEFSNWKNTPLLAKNTASKHPLTPRHHLTVHTCVDVVAVRCFPQSFHSCGDKKFKVISMQILLYDWMNGVRATKTVLVWRVTDITVINSHPWEILTLNNDIKEITLDRCWDIDYHNMI